MSKKNINVLDRIQEILDREKRPFTTVKKLASKLRVKEKKELGISGHEKSSEIIHAIKNFSEDERFIFNKKGSSNYILEPCQPEDLILAEMSLNEGKSLNSIARPMPFTKKECSKIFNSLFNSLIKEGRIKIFVTENLDTKFFLTNSNSNHNFAPEYPEYTVENFRKAFDVNNVLPNGSERIFVRIYDIRNTLNWPREVFDNMLKDLRDKRIITLHILEMAGMTQKNIDDSFIDENNFRMGTVTWNVK